MDEPAEHHRSIRDHLDHLMPPGGGARRLVGWGVVAWTGIGLAILIGVAGRALGRMAAILPYLVVAAMVVFILNPAVRRLVAMGLPRRLAATLVFAAALGLTVLLLSLAVPVLVHQGQSLVQNAPGYLRRSGNVVDRLSRSSNPLLHQAGQASAGWLRENAGSAPKALNTLVTAGLELAHAGAILLIGGFLGFLLLLSLPETARGFSALIPPGSRATIEPPLTEVRRIVSGYVRARLIVSAVVGVLATLGMWAIDMPFWLVLGIIVGVANLIPMLGSYIGGAPVALVALLTKPPSYLILVLAVVVASHMVDGFILSPIVLKETTNLHPVVILLVVLIGADLLGFWGILAAIPVAGVIQFLLREWVVPRIPGRAPEAAAPAVGVPG
jgi:predicted PurR-regulated permease PerM